MKNLFTSHRLIVALFAALFTLTLHNISNAQTQIHVDAVNGKNEATGRGAAGKAYKSITYALLISDKNNLPEPWHVHIHPGTYNADPAKPPNEREVFPIRLRSKMLFQGTTTAAECIIDAQHLGESQTPILLGEDVGDASIRNLTIQNMNRTGSEPPNAGGIVFSDTGGGREAASSIEACIVHNNAPRGVATDLPLILIGNTFSNDGYLVGVWTNTNFTVLKNTFSDNGTGLWIEGDSTGNISNNIFQNNDSYHHAGGIHATGTLNGNITHNTFTNNSHGGGEAGGFVVQRGFNGNVTHNTFTGNIGEGGNSGGGFKIRSMTGNVIHNTFTDNTGGHAGGFFVESFTGNITHNEFIGNTSRGGSAFSATFGAVSYVTHNLFDSNSSLGDYGTVWLVNNSTITEFTNNIFFNNTASGNVSAVYLDGVPSGAFMNNLFMVADGLSAAASIPAVKVRNPEWRFHNNIFSGMTTAIHIEGTFDLPITHNLFHNIGADFVSQGGAGVGNDLAFWELLADGANNNIVGGLLLVDAANGDFHPVAGSPTINAGTNQYAPADDFDGTARPVGGGIDIGPYEYKQIADQTATFIPEDVNQDGRVSIADVIEVAQALGKQVSEKPRADVNGDGAISFADLVAIARALAKARSGAAAPSQKAVVLDAATVQTWLQLARIEDDGSLMFREGIANLEQLLASLLPKETILLTNYPNPFNPETWIPYRLAKPAKVSIAIHTANGQLVRVLALGTQSAGIYQHRSRAAYWNGKNEVGEPVASGVYFYTLTAGEFTSTRKMLIRK